MANLGNLTCMCDLFSGSFVFPFDWSSCSLFCYHNRGELGETFVWLCQSVQFNSVAKRDSASAEVMIKKEPLANRACVRVCMFDES